MNSAFRLRFMRKVAWGREVKDEDPEQGAGVAGRGGGMPWVPGDGSFKKEDDIPMEAGGVSERVWAMDLEEHGVTSGNLGEFCKSQFYRV